MASKLNFTLRHSILFRTDRKICKENRSKITPTENLFKYVVWDRFKKLKWLVKIECCTIESNHLRTLNNEQKTSTWFICLKINRRSSSGKWFNCRHDRCYVVISTSVQFTLFTNHHDDSDIIYQNKVVFGRKKGNIEVKSLNRVER